MQQRPRPTAGGAGARALRRTILIVALAAAPFPGPLPVRARAADAPAPAWPEPDGTLVLTRPFDRSEIALRLSRAAAGAVDALTWNGVAFIAAAGAGGALQASATLDPEADGRRADEVGGGVGDSAPRRLRALRYGRSWAETVAALAFAPAAAGPVPGALPEVLLRKRVAVGLPGLGNAVEVQASFELSAPVRSARFEALAVSVPAEFAEAWEFDPATGEIGRLAPGPDDRTRPVILALPEGSHALAVWSPPRDPAEGGPMRFGIRPGGGATRLSCAVRVAPAAAGAHDIACYALVGSLAAVRSALRTLTTPP
jgi:hypothetical protein